MSEDAHEVDAVVQARVKEYHATRALIAKAPNPYADGTYQHALFAALQIWDEYMSQIGKCCAQDYGRLASFPSLCSRLGVELPRLPRGDER